MSLFSIIGPGFDWGDPEPAERYSQAWWDWAARERTRKTGSPNIVSGFDVLGNPDNSKAGRVDFSTATEATHGWLGKEAEYLRRIGAVNRDGTLKPKEERIALATADRTAFEAARDRDGSPSLGDRAAELWRAIKKGIASIFPNLEPVAVVAVALVALLLLK